MKMSVIEFIGNVFKIIITFLLSLVLFLIGIIFFSCCIPIYIIRSCVSLIGKFCRPDLCKILTTRSSIFAVDDLYKRPKATLLVFMILDGHVSLEEGRSFIQKQLVLARDPNGQLTRPELQQFISKWMGFYFWKKDEHFNICNHLSIYDGPLRALQYNETHLYRIANELVTKPFTKYRSPWEFLLFPNCVDDNGQNPATAVCLKIHHAIADGFSILKLVNELITSEGRILPMTPNYSRSEGIYLFLETLLTCIQAPYKFAQLILKYDHNDWHIPENQISGKCNGAVLEKISVDYIKEIKNQANSTFTAVLLAAFSGGIRSFMIEQKVNVPQRIHCITPLPMVGHPNKMRNFMTLCYVTLPIGIADPIERLRAIDKHLSKLKRNTLPIFFFYLIPFVGGLFPCLTRCFSKQTLVTAIMSNFPGPPDLVSYCGIPVKDMIFTGGMLPGNIGVGLASISYNGHIRIAAGVDEAILPSRIPVRSLIDKVGMELDVLRKELSV